MMQGGSTPISPLHKSVTLAKPLTQQYVEAVASTGSSLPSVKMWFSGTDPQPVPPQSPQPTGQQYVLEESATPSMPSTLQLSSTMSAGGHDGWRGWRGGRGVVAFVVVEMGGKWFDLDSRERRNSSVVSVSRVCGIAASRKLRTGVGGWGGVLVFGFVVRTACN